MVIYRDCMRRWIAVLLPLLGCSRPQENVAARDPAASAPMAPTTPVAASTGANPTAPTPTDPSLDAGASVGGRVVVSLGPTFGEFSVEAKSAVELRTAIEVERLDGSKWDVQVADLHLIDACPTKGTTVPPCRKLAAGAIVRPPRYTGYTCSSQCAVDCDKNVQLNGTVRYVVRSCDGTERWHSAPVKVTPASP